MNDIMDSLAAARPSRLDPDTDPGRRYRDLETAMAHPPERPYRHRTTHRAVRRRVTAGLGLVAVGAAAALAIATVADDGPTGTGPGTPSKPTLSGIELAAVKAQTLPTGKYWFSDDVFAQSVIVHAKTGDYAVAAFGDEGFQWTAAKVSGGDGGAQRDLPFRPMSATDKAAWRRAGSPTTLRVPADDHTDTLRSTPGQWTTWKSKLLGGSSDSAGGRFQLGLTVKQIENLPTDPGKLAKLLFQSDKMKRLDPGFTRDAGTQWAAVDKFLIVRAMLNGPVTPRLQAALMRVLKAQPGIREIGRVTDRLGRKGVALGVDYPDEFRGSSKKPPFGSQRQLVFDPKTGKFLGDQNVLTRPGGRYASRKPGFVMDFTVVRDSGWTDTRPEHPTSLPF